MKQRGQMEFSFAWLFAIIVGIVILGIAIYAAVKIIGVGDQEVSAKTSKQIEVLLNPLEMGFEGDKVNSFSLPVESRIYIGCDEEDNFGHQIIRVSQTSFNKWVETDLDVKFENKFIAAGNYEEGKEFYLFSKPFNFPFKVADIVYLLSSKSKYCFLSPNEDVKEYLDFLNKPSLRYGNCSNEDGFTNICFENSGKCDVLVNYAQGVVSKNNTNLYFNDDALMFAAIYSSPKKYECLVKRLMKKTAILSELYIEKGAFVTREGCNSELLVLDSGFSSGAKLKDLKTAAESLVNLGSSRNILSVALISEEINKKSESALCKLW